MTWLDAFVYGLLACLLGVSVTRLAYWRGRRDGAVEALATWERFLSGSCGCRCRHMDALMEAAKPGGDA